MIWDFVGTLALPRESPGFTYARMARRYSIVADPEEIVQRLRKALKTPPPLRSQGGDELEESQGWWRTRVALALKIPVEKLPEPLFQELWEYFGSPKAWVVRREARELLLLLERRGIPMAILSNNDSRLYRIVEGLGIPVPPSHVLPSSLLPQAKPHALAFAEARKVLALPPQNLLLVDDDPENCQAALSLGFASACTLEEAARALFQEGLVRETP